jgi:hypothetical protein
MLRRPFLYLFRQSSVERHKWPLGDKYFVLFDAQRLCQSPVTLYFGPFSDPMVLNVSRRLSISLSIVYVNIDTFPSAPSLKFLPDTITMLPLWSDRMGDNSGR